MYCHGDPAYRVHALLFDMDGTLVNSIAVVERTWTRFARRHGLDVDKVIAECHGCRVSETVAKFVPRGISVAEETARVEADEVSDVEGIVEIEGAARLLAALPEGRWAVVTSATRNLASVRMAAAGLVPPPVLIAAEDIHKGKPEPDGYLAAAAALGVAPSDCLVFEDAPAGIQAGHAAGAKVVAVATAAGARYAAGFPSVRDLASLHVGMASDGRIDVFLQ